MVIQMEDQDVLCIPGLLECGLRRILHSALLHLVDFYIEAVQHDNLGA